ncbi:hypothetical protein [Pengzhenrongella sp.]|uniref:hypothetical protein n=1 Tax=Pengzhenrongella sp. TaxID=2888820 RepID=UPI002F93FA4B
MAITSEHVEGADPPAPDVLELRIHGISNTPVAGMLDLPLDQIEQVAGDSLAGFWAPTADAAAQGAGLPSGDRHHIHPGVRREAYSWGLLARTVPGGTGRIAGVVGAAAARIAWTLLIPFGLANAAYWSRAIPEPGENRQGWRDAGGAASLRVFALALTLLYVTSASAVSLDLFAVQCYPGGHEACGRLPDVLWTRDQRLAVAAVIPILLILGLFALSWVARMRFDAQISRPAAKGHVNVLPDERTEGRQEGPVLAATGFWQAQRLSITTARLHVAGGLCLVALCLAWDKVVAPWPQCRSPQTFFGSTCLAHLRRDVSPDDRAMIWLGALAAVVLVLVVCRVAIAAESSVDVERHPDHPTRYIWSGWLLLGASGVLVGTGIVLWAPWIPQAEQLDRNVASESAGSMLGLVTTPAVLVGVLLALAAGGLGWRRWVRARWWLTLLAVAGVCLLLARLWPTPDAAVGWVGAVGANRRWFLVAAILALGTDLFVVWRGPTAPGSNRSGTRDGHRHEGWAGAGPGVFMLLAAGAAMVLSSLLVAGTAIWLNSSSTKPRVNVPLVYREFGAAVVAAFVLLLVAVGLLAWTRRSVAFIPPARGSRPTPLTGTDDPRALRDPASRALLSIGALRVLKGRWLAAGTQLAEPVVGGLAAAMGIALVATLARVRFGGYLEFVGAWALRAAALAIVAGAVASVRAGKGRPLGVLWDLMCFLPRAAHPFGPASYAERVVPELRGRVDAWLEVPTRSVVLSAHSLGAVLAVACLFARESDEPPAGEHDDPARPRVGLLTYGTQLRPYFGRFFPELLGAKVLGTATCLAPHPGAPDPWQRRDDDPPDSDYAPADDALDRDTVMRRLWGREAGRPTRRPAWINLWRRTDFLGFPVISYGRNDVDRGEEEVDRTGYLFTVATHGGDPRSAAYPRAFADLLQRMGVSS